MCHHGERHRLCNYLPGTHVEATELCVDTSLVASTSGTIATRTRRTRGYLAASLEFHGIGPRLSEPRDGDAAGGGTRCSLAPAQCALAGRWFCPGLARNRPRSPVTHRGS